MMIAEIHDAVGMILANVAATLGPTFGEESSSPQGWWMRPTPITSGSCRSHRWG
jgi:hypothetical protein